MGAGRGGGCGGARGGGGGSCGEAAGGEQGPGRHFHRAPGLGRPRAEAEQRDPARRHRKVCTRQATSPQTTCMCHALSPFKLCATTKTTSPLAWHHKSATRGTWESPVISDAACPALIPAETGHMPKMCLLWRSHEVPERQGGCMV
jgi:hypothetical protein